MKRTLVFIMAAGATLIGAASAGGQTPDVSAPPATGSITPSAPANTSPSFDALEAERLAIWSSPEMIEARAWVEEYGRRSRRFTSAMAEQFLVQLRRKSPEEMRVWLARYQARKANLARAADVEQQAREFRIQRALEQQQAAQQSAETFRQGQAQGAWQAGEQIRLQHEFSDLMSTQRRAFRDAQLADRRAEDYQWMLNPPLWVQQRYAAATLPGDLPAWDPRNFIRGDVAAPADIGRGPNAGPSGEGAGPNAGPAANGSASGPNAGPGVGGGGPNSGPGPQ